jgi:predicted amidohydrolase
MTAESEVIVAWLQMEPVFGRKEENTAASLHLIDEAAKRRAKLLVSSGIM